MSRLALLLAAGLLLAGCQSEIPKELTPVPRALQSRMDTLAMNETAPIYIRIFKEESTLEVWKQRRDGRYALLKSYEICKWSGELGPKLKEGDRQAPEGFYTVTRAQMNPQSSYHLAFNIGYPNAFDSAHGRTGKHLMVHGACSSAGCYSMTDEQVEEIFALARDSFRGGQTAFQVHAFPFRMTAENMARHADNPNMPFWRTLKLGYDHFEVTQVVPKVDVCNKNYVFNATPNQGGFSAVAECPPYAVPEVIATAVSAKQQADEAAFQIALAAAKDGQPSTVPQSAAAYAPQAAAATGAGAPDAGIPGQSPNPLPPQTTAPAEPGSPPSLLSRLFRRAAGALTPPTETPTSSAPAAAARLPETAPAVAATAPAPTDEAIQRPQARPTDIPAAATRPQPPQQKPAPAVAAVEMQPTISQPAAAPSAPAAPRPAARPETPPAPAEPAPNAAAATTTTPGAATAAPMPVPQANDLFNNRFVVPNATTLTPAGGAS